MPSKLETVQWLRNQGYVKLAGLLDKQLPFATDDPGLQAAGFNPPQLYHAAIMLQSMYFESASPLNSPPLPPDVKPSMLGNNVALGRHENSIMMRQLRIRSSYQGLMDYLRREERLLLNPGSSGIDAFFDRQRQIVRQTIGAGHPAKVDEFKKCMDTGQGNLAKQPNANATLFHEERKAPSNPNASIVFMGMKSLKESVAFAIVKYGITALKFLAHAPSGPEDFKQCAAKDPTHARNMRTRLVSELPRKGTALDEFKLLQLANAHKSGPGVSTSGFHSTSGKPSYAAEYSVGPAQKPGDTCYNLGVAIEVTDGCYPLVIQEAIEGWNKHRADESNKIVMAFSKDDPAWKRDFESEILLGGASPSVDFVYLCLWKVTWPANTGVRFGGLGNIQLKKVQ